MKEMTKELTKGPEIDQMLALKLTELDALIGLLQNSDLELSNEVKAKYFKRIDELMLEMKELRIHRIFESFNGPSW